MVEIVGEPRQPGWTDPLTIANKTGLVPAIDRPADGRLLDRVVHNAHRLKLKGPSKRKAET